jgi:SPP1 gp7 family putative phage head morphogenesis protein
MALPRREKIGGGEGIGWRFDSKNEMAQAYAARQAARYVTQVSAETKAGLQSIIAKSVREGINARDTAKLIKSSVGLNAPQGAAVNNYYNKLIARGTDPGRAWKLADKYSDKLLKSRAKTIARTEIMGALNGGALEQARQRRDAGLYQNPMKKWKITKDEVTCKICRPLEGQIRPLEGTFSTGVTAPPTHPNCRCTLSFFDAVDQQAAEVPAKTPEDMFGNAEGDARLNMSGVRGHTDVSLSEALDERNAHMISYDGYITRGGQRIRVRVVTTNQDDQDRSFRRVLGHRVSLREKLSAVGFHIPKGARSIAITGGGEDIKVKILGEDGFHDSIQMSRMWFASRSGKLYQENSYFGVKGSFARKGYAREVMRRSITGASEIG